VTDQNPGMKIENITKKEEWVKSEYGMKREHIKEEFRAKLENMGSSNFMYILDDNDDDVTFVGTSKKKLKFEATDLEGTLVEGISSFEKINMDKDG
jgi:hypothetical protein